MLLIGLTGSIGMGKSETAKMFRALGVPVYDADAAVHKLYDKGGKAVEPIRAAFPLRRHGRCGRPQGAVRAVLGLPDEMKKLEAIVHPLVGEAQIEFLKENMAAGHEMAVLDIPLLYETGGETRVDVCGRRLRPLRYPEDACAGAARHGRGEIRRHPREADAGCRKRERADFIVESDKGLDHAREQVSAIVDALKGREGKVLKASSSPHG